MQTALSCARMGQIGPVQHALTAAPHSSDLQVAKAIQCRGMQNFLAERIQARLQLMGLS